MFRVQRPISYQTSFQSLAGRALRCDDILPADIYSPQREGLLIHVGRCRDLNAYSNNEIYI